MADTITKCVAVNDAAGHLNRYQVTFTIDLSSVHKPSVNHTIVVFAKNLRNPTDLTEVKTAACALACGNKQRLLAHLAETSTTVAITGPVTL